MSSDWLTLDDLAAHLGRDRREIERMANRGRIPCHRRSGGWQFHPAEVTQWLEQEMRAYSDSQLAAVEKSQHSEEVDADIPVSSLLQPEMVEVPLQARTKRSVLESLVEVAGRTWNVWQPAALLAAIQEREELMSTAFDNGVAVPHPRLPVADVVADSLIAFGRTLSGIPFGAPNNCPSDLFFLVVCRDAQTHLHVLARLGRMIQKAEFVEALRVSQDSTAAYEVILRADEAIS